MSETQSLFLNRASQVFKDVQFTKIDESDFFLTVKLETKNLDSEVIGFVSEIGDDKTKNLFIPFNK